MDSVSRLRSQVRPQWLGRNQSWAVHDLLAGSFLATLLCPRVSVREALLGRDGLAVWR